MSLIACERLAKPRSPTIASSSVSSSSGSEMLMRLTGRPWIVSSESIGSPFLVSEQVTVALDLPRADREVVGLPFGRLVEDELVAKLAAERLLDQRIGGKGGHRLLQVLRQERDAAFPP